MKQIITPTKMISVSLNICWKYLAQANEICRTGQDVFRSFNAEMTVLIKNHKGLTAITSMRCKVIAVNLN